MEIRTEGDGDQRRLRICGDLDIAGAESLLECVDGLLNDGVRRFVIDLAPCEFVDSSGLAGLLRASREVHLRDATLEVHAPTGHQSRILMDLSGTASTLGLQPA
jgi:anti-anti-sigma factor